VAVATPKETQAMIGVIHCRFMVIAFFVKECVLRHSRINDRQIQPSMAQTGTAKGDYIGHLNSNSQFPTITAFSTLTTAVCIGCTPNTNFKNAADRVQFWRVSWVWWV
jgi:hypothetical protein